MGVFCEYYYRHFFTLCARFLVSQWAPLAASCAPNSVESVRMRRTKMRTWRGRWMKTNRGRSTASTASWETDVSSTSVVVTLFFMSLQSTYGLKTKWWFKWFIEVSFRLTLVVLLSVFYGYFGCLGISGEMRRGLLVLRSDFDRETRLSFTKIH